MSGSTDAATIAERTKLEQQLREAQEGLDDTYYDHAMDSKSQALDDELEAYTKSSEDYIKSLRESIKDTKRVVEETFLEVLSNADIVLSEINRLSGEYGFYIDDNLKNPWINAANQATAFKNTSGSSVEALINENGIITLFGSEATRAKLSGTFGAGSAAASTFATDVGTHMGAIETTVNSYTSPEQTKYLGTKLKYPWEDAVNGPKTFSSEAQRFMTQEVVGYAQQNYQNQLKDILNWPWDNAGAYDSWGQGAQNTLQGVINKANETARAISNAANTKTPSYTSVPPATSTNSNYNVKGNIYDNNVKNLQKILKDYFGYNLNPDGEFKNNGVDGYYGDENGATWQAVQKLQYKLQASKVSYASDRVKATGWYDATTAQALRDYLNRMAPWALSNLNLLSVPTAMYAKGTLGTTHDQFAITDESWIGEEITLAAGKNGQLQYLKKGSAVMPADISANLVEWGKLNPNMLSVSNITDGVNMISNYVSKPEIKLDVENFLRVDRVDKDSLPELEKLMDKKIDTFAKQLNQSLRKFK